jgi:dihydrofolate reductase
VPARVLRHEIPKEISREASASTSVTGGIASALRQAKAIAGDKNVLVLGGANTVKRYIQAGLVDEVQIYLVLLGEGIRLFGHLAGEPIERERTKVIEFPGVTPLKFRGGKK